MKTYYGNALKEYIDERFNVNYKERFILQDLMDYLYAENDVRVCCLCGLQYTGKKTMIMQAIKKIDDYDRCLLIRCESNRDEGAEGDFWRDTVGSVCKTIDEYLNQNPNFKYIFIDEVTQAEYFAVACERFADGYTSKGMKIILTGTDSLAFYFVKVKELSDRGCYIDTSFISYEEYQYLLNKDERYYVRYGGTLTDGKETVFYHPGTTKSYIHSAIVENISNTLGLLRNGNTFLYLAYKYLIENNEYDAYIHKILKVINSKFLADIIIRGFESEEMQCKVKEYFMIEEYYSMVTDKGFETTIYHLFRIGVMYRISDDDWRIVLPGLRYCLVKELLDDFMNSDVVAELSEEEKDRFKMDIKFFVREKIWNEVRFYEHNRKIL